MLAELDAARAAAPAPGSTASPQPVTEQPDEPAVASEQQPADAPPTVTADPAPTPNIEQPERTVASEQSEQSEQSRANTERTEQTARANSGDRTAANTSDGDDVTLIPSVEPGSTADPEPMFEPGAKQGLGAGVRSGHQTVELLSVFDANTEQTANEHRTAATVAPAAEAVAGREQAVVAEAGRPGPTKWGAGAFYVVAVMSMLVSLDTSWFFFEEQLHVDNIWIRAGMFAVLEMALIACGIGMASNVRRKHGPGSAQLTAWILCGFSGYMAVTWAGPIEGVARVALGPVLGMVMLHHALGIEKRAHSGRSGALARLGRELRERALSRLGLADDDRDAAQRTRDRAARRVAALVHGKHVLLREARVARAARIANISTDPAQRETMLAELATRRGLASLRSLEQKAPWE
ncbi:hypothetical protein [Nocardia cyriacigeorgica]|uniref:hypothetical protein n=1 Tax=Nocardia cyriacigeorgica TaxID=135487 RepID=UPI002458D836|nr:hypothetical protein [Nocardia cyriacigeorgica]